MKKSLRITLTAVVLMSVAQIAAATAAPGGTDPHPQSAAVVLSAPGGTDPHPQAVGGTDPHPQSVLSVNEIVAAILSMIGL